MKRATANFSLSLATIYATLLGPTNIAHGQEIAGAESKLLTIDHYFELAAVSDAVISPEGSWVAYTLSRENLKEDKSRSRIWMIPVDGGSPVPLTTKAESSSSPRWSPDSKQLAFLSARDAGETQIWTLNRLGGEAVQLTDTIQSIEAFDWSPDATKVAMLLQDPSPEQIEAAEKGDDYKKSTPRPWVINRQQFKEDYVGYLDNRRTHIFILDIASGKTTQLTSGDFDDSELAWSPDGSRIAFTSNRTEHPDDNYNDDIWVVHIDGSGPLIQISSNPGADGNPAWSPDGKSIAHTSMTDVDAMVYATQHLAVSSSAGGSTQVLTAELDRMIFSPRYAPDGASVWFLLEDSGEQILASIPASGGPITRMVTGQDVVDAFDFGPGGEVVASVSNPWLPSELFLFTAGQLKQLTFSNRELLHNIQLGEVLEVQFSSKDGAAIEGFIIKPVGFTEGQRYPTILDIHGGPQSQYDYGFNFDAQLYAAHGYLVVHPNPRGSTGYGQEFCLAIWQDWGGPDFDDVMAAVDDAARRGWADLDRLGVAGWSYGGILTNHVITKTQRFKAAATGASSTLYVVSYGHDMYQRWWERELGLPWEPEARERWERISPFNKVENVVTPTLILGGEKDWNVPIINSEQLYLALRKLGVETELVVYPDQFHGIDTPSLTRDLYQRHLDWFGRYLKKG